MNNVQHSKTWDQRLFTLLWAWISFRTLLPWLVFFRLTFEGSGYSWGAEYFGRMFHSSGLARPDFLVVYALLIVSLGIVYLLRQQNFRLAAPAIVLLLGFFAANTLFQALSGEPVIFRGDTLDVTLNVTTALLILNFGFFALSLLWWFGVRDVPRGPGPQTMSAHRRFILKLCAMIVPLQLILLMTGEPHGTTDAIGVILTLTQWALLAYCLYPGSAYRNN